MKKIKSFTIDHTILPPGLYYGGSNGDVDTFDLRMKKPNTAFLSIPAMHAIEHLFATYARSQWGDAIIYFGPMGCQTGFYLLTRGLTQAQVIALVRETIAFIAQYDGPIPGAAEAECGNYRNHDLPGARRECEQYLDVIRNWTTELLIYPQRQG